jgi:hypothetical protein
MGSSSRQAAILSGGLPGEALLLLAQWGMASGREPADVPPAMPVQAVRSEHWWPVALAIVVAAVLHVALPAKYRINPRGWSRPCCWACWPP